MKVTVLYRSRDPTYIRALQGHEMHNRLWGYSMMVLRHGLVEDGVRGMKGVWNKPAYLLGALLEEMRKGPGERAEWLL